MIEGGKRRPTLATLAGDLGISRATVSNAYNHPDQLSASLRTRILERADELGYSGPNPAARRLLDRSLTTIGVIFAEGVTYPFADPAAREFMSSLLAEAETHQVSILIVPAGRPHLEGRSAIENAVLDAIIIYSMPDDDATLHAALARRVPTVILDQPIVDGAPLVTFENRGGAREAMQHIIDLGHRQISVVTFRLGRDGQTGHPSLERQASAMYYIARERLAGYRDAIEASALSWADVRIEERPGGSKADGYAAAMQLLGGADRPTALAVFSDLMVEGVLDAAAELNLRVPEDLSVVGYDNIEDAERLGITTVGHDLKLKGEIVSTLLHNMWTPSGVGEGIVLPISLIVRESTAPPAR